MVIASIAGMVIAILGSGAVLVIALALKISAKHD